MSRHKFCPTKPPSSQLDELWVVVNDVRRRTLGPKTETTFFSSCFNQQMKTEEHQAHCLPHPFASPIRFENRTFFAKSFEESRAREMIVFGPGQVEQGWWQGFFYEIR